MSFAEVLRGHHIRGVLANSWIVDKLTKSTAESLVIDFFFLPKHKNAGKIESHMWFFKGFCKYLNPKLTQILDVGTLALPQSISRMALYMDMETQVGGVCGEIEVMVPEKMTWGESVVVSSQYVEYKVSHFLDKAFESFFGFVSVLPGAFSMFRWESIQGRPMESFFKGLHKDNHTPSEANMYLAEDRIMCLEILVKRNSNWILKYVPDCVALTDPPMSLNVLIKQRRRWTNGSLFAALHCFKNFPEVKKSSHSICRKVLIYLLFFYQMS